MQAMTGSQGAGRRGLHTMDDRGGTDFQGEKSGTGVLNVVREGIGEGVPGGAPQNSARRIERGIGAGGQQGSRGQ